MTLPDRLRRGLLVLGVVALGLAAGCTELHEDVDTTVPNGLIISDVVMALPAGPNTALYLTIENSTDTDDVLRSVGSAVSDRIELHETTSEDGLMRMHQVEDITVPAGGEVRLEPGGLHVMVFDVDPVDEDDLIAFELEFERKGRVTVHAGVESYADIHEH
jgi:copper(I)-binding protein